MQSIKKLNLQEIAENSIVETSPEYVQIQQEQLMKGLRSDGNNTFRLSTGSDEYSPGYAKIKGKNKPIDLYLTGAWQGGIHVSIDSTNIVVESSDSKNEKLQRIYGPEILGLNSESKADYIPTLENEFLNEVTQALNS